MKVVIEIADDISYTTKANFAQAIQRKFKHNPYVKKTTLDNAEEITQIFQEMIRYYPGKETLMKV